ncbi:MAG: response regulator [Sphingomonadales bacterium]|nr:MAG: response regulator [Sphingomonadales bacterium]
MQFHIVVPRFAVDRKKGPVPFAMPEASGREAAYLQTRVLIIEDEMMIAWMLESFLSEAGFTDIVMAADGEEARRAAIELAPGLVISDLNLGAGTNGLEASAAICQPKAIPVLFVTAYADEVTRELIAAQFPRAELLRKPVDSGALLGAVRRALQPTSHH